MKIYYTTYMVFSLFLLQGCVKTYMAVKNDTDHPITVSSAHTGKSYVVNENKTVMIPHSIGTMTVINDQGLQWEYDNVSALSGERKRHFIFWTKVVQDMTITNNQE